MDEINQLRREIFERVERYYDLEHRPRQERFTPGEGRIDYAGRVYDAREMLQLVDAALEFRLTAGRYCHEFERKLGEFVGCPYTLFVNSGSSANLLAFASLTSPRLGERRLRRGDEVITVAAGFPTTVAPIVQYGMVPVFIDVEAETANLDPELLESALSPRTRAVMAAHTLGNPFDLARVAAFCQKHSLWLIEDNCDALGSEFNGRRTGSFGDFGTSSFYPPHHLTTGEGGAVYTRDPLLYEIAMSMRDWGRDCRCPPGVDNLCKHRFEGRYGTLPAGYDHKYVYSHFGYNLKGTDLQAAIGCAQLEKLPEFVEARRANYRYLFERLGNLPELSVFRAIPGADPSWFGFLMTLTPEAKCGRNDLVTALEGAGIQTRNLFAGNLTRHPCFEGLEPGRDYRVINALPNTDRLMNDAFWIGLYPGMTPAKLDYMIQTIQENL